MFTIHGAFGWLSRWERINPRSGSPRLHRGFPVKGQLDWLAVLHSALKRQRLLATPHRSGLQCPRAPTMPSADSCSVFGAITDLSVPCMLWPAGTRCRSPGVSSCAFSAQPLDLRLWPLMDMDFVLSRALVRPQRLLSSFCSSARTSDTRFLQTSPHGDALALLSPSPPSGWQRDLHPPNTGTCPAHVKDPRRKQRGF